MKQKISNAPEELPLLPDTSRFHSAAYRFLQKNGRRKSSNYANNNDELTAVDNLLIIYTSIDLAKHILVFPLLPLLPTPIFPNDIYNPHPDSSPPERRRQNHHVLRGFLLPHAPPVSGQTSARRAVACRQAKTHADNDSATSGRAAPRYGSQQQVSRSTGHEPQ